jgi:hypothetical protein
MLKVPSARTSLHPILTDVTSHDTRQAPRILTRMAENFMQQRIQSHITQRNYDPVSLFPCVRQPSPSPISRFNFQPTHFLESNPIPNSITAAYKPPSQPYASAPAETTSLHAHTYTFPWRTYRFGPSVPLSKLELLLNLSEVRRLCVPFTLDGLARCLGAGRGTMRNSSFWVACLLGYGEIVPMENVGRV